MLTWAAGLVRFLAPMEDAAVDAGSVVVPSDHSLPSRRRAPPFLPQPAFAGP